MARRRPFAALLALAVLGASATAVGSHAAAAGASHAGPVRTAGIHFVGAADAGGGNAEIKRVVIPKRAAAGETALLFLASTTTSTWSAPSGVIGWKQVGSYSRNKLRTTVWAKVLRGHDAGSIVKITASGYSHAAFGVAVYAGVSASRPVRTSARRGDAGSTRHPTPIVTSTGDWVVSYWAGRAATPQRYTVPKGVKARVATRDSGRSLTVQSLLADSARTTRAGRYGGLVAATSVKTNQAVEWSILLRRASVGPTPVRTKPPVRTAPSCVSDSRGIPRQGAGALVGATASGTQSIGGLESRAGSLRIYRDYYTADQVNYAVGRTAADLRAGRLPWISFTLPYTWPQMAAGKGDAWTIDLVDKLAKLNGPVWLAFNHEPENDTGTEGTMQNWKAMQEHLAPIVHRNAPNIAFTVILMAWNTLFGPAEDRLHDVWPGSQNVDVLGLDLYNEYGAKAGHTQLDFTKYFTAIQAFTSTHGDVPWAIGETAYTARAAQNQAAFLQRYYSSLVTHGGVAMAYFDSSYNSIADWTLDDSLRLTAFREVLAESARIC